LLRSAGLFLCAIVGRARPSSGEFFALSNNFRRYILRAAEDIAADWPSFFATFFYDGCDDGTEFAVLARQMTSKALKCGSPVELYKMGKWNSLIDILYPIDVLDSFCSE
jgi:hypothetical protein